MILFCVGGECRVEAPGAVRRRNARCSISPVTRWPIWLWHRSSTRQRCGKAWVRGWRAELTVCFGSVRDRWPQTLAPFHEKGASHGSVQCCDEARFLGLFAARKLAQQLRGRGEFFDLPDSDVVNLEVHFGGDRVKCLPN